MIDKTDVDAIPLFPMIETNNMFLTYKINNQRKILNLNIESRPIKYQLNLL